MSRQRDFVGSLHPATIVVWVAHFALSTVVIDDFDLFDSAGAAPAGGKRARSNSSSSPASKPVVESTFDDGLFGDACVDIKIIVNYSINY